jgi:hypothetical protein
MEEETKQLPPVFTFRKSWSLDAFLGESMSTDQPSLGPLYMLISFYRPVISEGKKLTFGLLCASTSNTFSCLILTLSLYHT